jgi:hypothetical protein
MLPTFASPLPFPDTAPDGRLGTNLIVRYRWNGRLRTKRGRGMYLSPGAVGFWGRTKTAWLWHDGTETVIVAPEA